MSRRYWLPYVAAGIGIGVVISLLVALALQNHQRTSECEYYSAEPHCQNTANNSPNVRLTPSQREYGPSPDPYSERKEWREEQDLKAQRQMAEWAFWAVMAGLGSVAITGVGVILIALTLDETRKAVVVSAEGTKAAKQAVELTRKAHITEQRPWLAVRAVKMDRSILSQDVISAFIWIRFTNIGKTPALSVVPHSQTYLRTTGSNEIIADFGPRLAQIGHSHPGKSLVPGDWFEQGFNVLFVKKGVLASEAAVYKDKLILKIAVGAAYRSTLSDEMFRSARSYMVYINQVAEGNVPDNLLDFDELDGGSFFS